MKFSKQTQSFYPEWGNYKNLPQDAVTCGDDDDQLIYIKKDGETLDVVNGSVFIIPAPPKTLAQVQAEQIATLETAYNTEIQLPVAYMATTFQADEGSQNTLTKCLVAGSVPAGFYWLDATNAPIAMTFAELQGLAGVMLAQGQAAFVNLQAKKTAVRNATTEADVLKVVW